MAFIVVSDVAQLAVVAGSIVLGVVASSGYATFGKVAAENDTGGGHAEAGDSDVEFEIGKVGYRDVFVCGVSFRMISWLPTQQRVG